MFDVGHFVAKSDIRPGRVVRLSGDSFAVEEALGADASRDERIVGVAVVWHAKPSGFVGADKAALAGSPVRIYQDGEVGLALAASDVTAGQLLIAEASDADARVVPKPQHNDNGTNWVKYVVVGQALHNAKAGSFVRFRVRVQVILNKE